MSKTSRFRHRREKSNQRKAREAVHPKPVTRNNKEEKPLPQPLDSPITSADSIAGSLFDEDSPLNKPKALGSALVELSQGNPDERKLWKNTSGTSRTGSKLTLPAVRKDENLKRRRNSSTRKDVR